MKLLSLYIIVLLLALLVVRDKPTRLEGSYLRVADTLVVEKDTIPALEGGCIACAPVGN